MRISRDCPCPVVGTSTSFVSAAQTHGREANSCSSSSYDCFIPNQKGTDLRKEVWGFSRTCINLCVFFTHFIGLASTFLPSPTATVDITFQGQMAFLTPQMLAEKGFYKDASWSLTAEDNQEAVADIHASDSWEKTMKMRWKGPILGTTGGWMNLSPSQDIEE